MGIRVRTCSYKFFCISKENSNYKNETVQPAVSLKARSDAYGETAG